jgi:hypothetical protein
MNRRAIRPSGPWNVIMLDTVPCAPNMSFVAWYNDTCVGTKREWRCETASTERSWAELHERRQSMSPCG